MVSHTHTHTGTDQSHAAPSGIKVSVPHILGCCSHIITSRLGQFHKISFNNFFWRHSFHDFFWIFINEVGNHCWKFYWILFRKKFWLDYFLTFSNFFLLMSLLHLHAALFVLYSITNIKLSMITIVQLDMYVDTIFTILWVILYWIFF